MSIKTFEIIDEVPNMSKMDEHETVQRTLAASCLALLTPLTSHSWRDQILTACTKECSRGTRYYMYLSAAHETGITKGGGLS